MKALLLAGGYGTRLRPLTYTRPKHLLPIANKPHIEHVLDLLARHGVDEVVMLTSYLAEAFEGVIADARARGVTVEVTHEAEPLGTAGALKNAEPLLGEGTFLAFNADVLTDVDLSWLLDKHSAASAECTIMLTPVEDPSAFGVVPTEESGRVTGFIEKPPPGEAPTNLINAGVYVLEPSVLDRVPAGEVWSAERQLFPQLVDDGVMYAYGSDAYWMDIGTPQKYLAANLDVIHGRYEPEGLGEIAAGGVLADPSADVDESAELKEVSLGAASRVGAGAVVQRSVLLPGATVEQGAEVVGSILGERAVVTSRSVARDVTLADDERLDANASDASTSESGR